MDSDPLFKFRKDIATYSLHKAKCRIDLQREESLKYDEIELEEIFDDKLVKNIGYSNICTEYGDTSSVTRGKFSKDGRLYATVGSSGLGTVWKTQDSNSYDFCKEVTVMKGINKMCDLDMHPRIGQIPGSAPNIVTGCFNGQIFFWTYNPTLPQQKSIKIKAHGDRVNTVKFCPSGWAFLTASYDKTWSIWDFMKLKEISNQKGHLKQIHTLSMHPDASLVFTGDLAGWGMVWDLRTGKGVYELETNNSILASDFHPNGYELAIGGKNNLAEIFDLRRKLAVKSIPAHIKLISSLQYNEDGTLLMTASHDCTVKLWHGRNYTSIEEDLQHPTKITSISTCKDKVACTMIDRKWTMWANNSEKEKVKQEDIQEDIIQNNSQII